MCSPVERNENGARPDLIGHADFVARRTRRSHAGPPQTCFEYNLVLLMAQSATRLASRLMHIPSWWLNWSRRLILPDFFGDAEALLRGNIICFAFVFAVLHGHTRSGGLAVINWKREQCVFHLVLPRATNAPRRSNSTPLTPEVDPPDVRDGVNL